MNTQITETVKLTKETLPILKNHVKSGKFSSMIIAENKEAPLLVGSTLKSQMHKDNAVAKLDKVATLPENCGEIFVTLA